MLLLILLLIPFFLGLLSWRLERVSIWIPRWIALLGMTTIFFISLLLWIWVTKYNEILFLAKFLKINQDSIWKLEFICAWIPRFGINIHLALDGLSLLMLILSSILGLIAILSSWNEINYNNHPGLFYGNLLWIMGGTIGIILSIDMFLFFFFWEIVSIPVYFLISLWGYVGLNRKFRVTAATKFFIYMQCSGLCMLTSIIALVSINYNFCGRWSFNYEDLLGIVLPKYVECFLMLGFFLAFAIKMPIVPFHIWSVDAHSYSPNSGSVDIMGILIKTAIYGFFRFSLPLFPYASEFFSPIIMFLGILNIFYGAWMAYIQTDMKRFLAYTNISHMGFSIIAIYSSNHLSYQGAIIQMISYSLSTSGMFILGGQLYTRLNTRNIIEMSGLWHRINLISVFYICFLITMLGIPGTGNFVGEILILFGVFYKFPIITIISAMGILFTSMYSLMLIQRIYYYSNSRVMYTLLPDMTYREKCIIIILLLCILVIGLFPQFILDVSYETMYNLRT